MFESVVGRQINVLTNENPGDEGMRIISIQVAGDIGHAEHVQLLLTTSTSGIHREQDGPGDDAPDKANGGRDL